LSYAADKQTDKQTDILSTPTDILGVGNSNIYRRSTVNDSEN